MFGGCTQLTTTVEHFHCLNSAQQFYYCVLGSSWSPEHLIDRSEKHIFRLSFDFTVRTLLKGTTVLVERYWRNTCTCTVPYVQCSYVYVLTVWPVNFEEDLSVELSSKTF